MVSSVAVRVPDYLAELPAERRAVVSRVRELVRKSLPPGYEEAMNWGMICWQIPLSRYPDTYNGQPLGYVALAAQKGCYGLYLIGPYMDSGRDAALREAYRLAGKKLDMGKSCVRFRSLDDLLLPAIAEAVASLPVDEYLRLYEKNRPKKKK
jgi:hypothetical protein